jgi:hypothetical protein
MEEKQEIITIHINGKQFSFSYSKMDYYAKQIADSIKSWMNDQKDLLPKEKYLQLLCNYQELIKRGNI